MKQYELSGEEKLTYSRQMKVEIPDDVSYDSFMKILDKVEREAMAFDEIPMLLDDHGIKTVIRPDDSLSSPWETEIEIFDCVEVD